MKKFAVILIASLLTAAVFAQDKADGPADRPARPKPRTNLDAFLEGPAEPASQPTSRPVQADTGITPPERNPFAKQDSPGLRDDALPGVIELSDGTQIPGRLFTTRDQPWTVFVESEKRWRRIPFITVLSITPVVVEEKMEQEWRWKEFGAPEKVYTGESYPTRRFLWKFHLIDGSTITGAVKGKPLWAELGEKRYGPWLLPERSRGKNGQKMSELVYVKKVIISKKMMNKVLRATPASRPDGRTTHPVK